MTRRKQKFSREKSRTMWLAWCAWLVIGGIFVFEDTQGGTGWLTWMMTAPFWVAATLWPFLWIWLVTRRDTAFVEIDDDIVSDTCKCRMVQKNGVRYTEKDDVTKTFAIKAPLSSVKLEGGDELFVKIDNLRPLAKENKPLSDWIAVVDSVSFPRCYY